MTILIFFAVLVVLILVHELGHFLVAKAAGIRVDEFGIGFPPKLFGKKFGETEYTLNLLPIGGFVRIWGEDPTSVIGVDNDKERSFVSKPRHIQALVLLAGVAMNVLLAFGLYVTAYSIGIPTVVDESERPDLVPLAALYVNSVSENTPAALSLKPSDEIVSLRSGNERFDDTAGLLPSKVALFVDAHGGSEVVFEIVRGGELHTVTVVPERGVIQEEPERFAVGFSMSLIALESVPFNEAIFVGAKRTYDSLVGITIGLGNLVKQIFSGTADYRQVAGPVGIVGMVGDAASLGTSWLLTFVAYISLNLAIINLLPVPALDGGRILFVLIESITRKTIKPIIAQRLNQFGFIFLLSLMALVTFNDIAKIF